MNPRRCAYDAFRDVNKDGAYANLRLKALPASLTGDERRRAYALVYTAFEHLLTVDYRLSPYLNRLPKPAVRDVLRLGATELLYFSAPAYAVVNEYTSLARSLGKGESVGKLVNAVLRALTRDIEGNAFLPFPKDTPSRLSLQYSYPAPIVSLWLNAYGEAFTEALLSAPQAKLTVRAQYPFSRDALKVELPVSAKIGAWDENALLLERGFDVTSLPAYTDGRMSVMGESAMLCCRALGNVSGLRVLDACAAPGGKSAYLCSLCAGDVNLTCTELHPHRTALLQETLSRLHVKADVQTRDASEFFPAFEQAFDAVLVDAPCSGLGLLLDKPDLRYQKSEADISSLAALQKRILCNCARYVKQGGALLYATCTISRAENEAQILSFLEENPSFSLEPMPIPVENDGMLQLFPSVHGVDGFFLARMRKCTKQST